MSLMAMARSSSGATGEGEGATAGVGEDCSAPGEIRATASAVGTGAVEGEAAAVFGATGGGVDRSSGRSCARGAAGLAGAIKCQRPTAARRRTTANIAAT